VTIKEKLEQLLVYLFIINTH